MDKLITYLTFDGNCREAMTFYKECLNAELELMAFADMPGDIPPGSKDRIMHARLTKGAATLMASDTMPGHPWTQGNNFSVSVNCDSEADVTKLFSAFAAKGKVTMDLQDTFWGAKFGMLTDQFGVQWMFNWDKPKA